MTVKIIRENILKDNEDHAAQVRKDLNRIGISMINLISSPGSGKTSILEKILPLMKGRGVNCGVIEGDCFTARDAERIDAMGTPVIQINTGNSCHLEAVTVQKALADLPLKNLDFVVVENVGNMVCPAEFDVGESAKVALLSVAEGHDKPEKYPLLFQEAKLVILNKTDLLPYTDFDLEAFQRSLGQVNSTVPVVFVSCRTGEGLEDLVQLLINLWNKSSMNQPKEAK